jgi:branched-chain amino acid transport system permease protein
MSGATWRDAAGAVVAVGAVLTALSRTPLQRVLDAVREDEAIAAALGIDVPGVKVRAFAASAAIAALAGALYGHYIAFVRPDDFDMKIGVGAVLSVILGGTNNVVGPALGAAFMTLVPEYIGAVKEWKPSVFAALVIVVLLFRRDGLVSLRLVTTRVSS